MAQQTIDLGSAPNDGTGDTIRDGGTKINSNFTELYARTLDDLPDVDAYEPADGDILVWDASAGAWINAPQSESGAVAVEDDGSEVVAVASRLNFTGAGVTVSDSGSGEVEVAIPGGGGSGNAWNLQGGPLDAELPSANYATLDARNGHPVLDFDTTTQESAIWTRAMPADYGGGGITVNIWCALTSATSGTVGWEVSIERIDASSLDIDADSFATAQTVTATTVPGTSGQVLKLSVNISNGANMDSLVAGELFRIKIARDVANDTAAGDAELLRWEMVEQ